MKTPDLATIDEALIDGVRDRIVEAFDPEAVYLFGSAARGESRYGSDLDLLVAARLPEEVEEAEPLDEEYAPAEGDEKVSDDFAAEAILEKAGA